MLAVAVLASLNAGGDARRAIEALSFGSDPIVDSGPGIGTRITFADRVLALAGYHRAVGLRGLVRGLDAAKPALVERVLDTRRVEVCRSSGIRIPAE